MFHGVGGFAGSVELTPPSATQMNSILPGLLRGYAVASTDTGHQGPGTGVDASWRSTWGEKVDSVTVGLTQQRISEGTDQCVLRKSIAIVLLCRVFEWGPDGGHGGATIPGGF